MTEKWEDFLGITGITLAAIPGEAAWTTLLAYFLSKIPYVGIPIAILVGSIGAFGTVWIGRVCELSYKDWYKKYCIK